MSANQTEPVIIASPPAGKPVSMADVAKKITSRTTDFLAICLVLAASLTSGVQIVSWWQAAAPANPSADPTFAAPGWDDTLQPVDLEFGDVPLALTRQIVVGDQPAAIEALVRHCQSAATSAQAPQAHADAVEIRILRRIAELTPAAEEPGVWQVYVVDDRFPLVVGVKLNAPVADERPGHVAGSDGPNVSDHAGLRLVCYGIAMPAGERTWTLFIMKGTPAAQSSMANPGSLPLPPGAERTLSLRDERGNLLLGFSGRGVPEEWIKFYDDLSVTRSWKRSVDWSPGNESWAARFARREGDWLDVRFAKDRRGELTGVLQVIPISTN